MLVISAASPVGTPGVVCLSVSGDVDAGTVGQLRAALDDVVARRPFRLELELSGVTFFSCAGLSVLLAARRAVRSIVIVAASRPVHRLLDILQVQPLFGRSAATYRFGST